MQEGDIQIRGFQLRMPLDIQFVFTANPEDYTNTVYFNNYIDWLGDVSHYNLYRSVNREPFVLIPIHTFYPGDSLIFIDLVSEFFDGNGRFCYYIEAVEGGSNDFGFSERSLSNIVCVS